MLTRQQCVTLHEKYHTPRHILKHCLAVRKVALFLADKLLEHGITINRNLLDRAALLHDLVKIINFKALDYEHFDLPMSDADKRYWEHLRKKYCGRRHEDVAGEIIMPYDPQLAELIRKHRYSCIIEEPYSWDEKVLYYADLRVNFDTIVSLHERLEKGHERNKHIATAVPREDILPKVCALESEIFTVLGLPPDILLTLNKPPTKALLFDYDGVLINSFPITMLVYDTIATTLNLKKPDTPAAYRQLFEADWRKALQKLGVTSEKDIAYSEQAFKEISMHHRDKIHLHSGIASVLEKLKNHYQLAIVSNNFKLQISQRLEALGIASYFECIIDHKYGIKPDPKPINACLAKLGVSAEQAVLIGDMDGDIEAGKRAQLKKVIAVTYGYHPLERLQDADEFIDHPSELPYIVE